MASGWPISTREIGRWTLIGIPQRLGDGRPPERMTFESFPVLEMLIGENWLREILMVVLPKSLPWAWWTSSSTAGLRQLSSQRMPAAVPLRSLRGVLLRRFFFQGMTQVILPAAQSDGQAVVLEWAGIDTEHQPEFIWTAPDTLDVWNTKAIAAWCRSKTAWRDFNSIPNLPAERVVALFDGDVFCAAPTAVARAVIETLRHKANEWNIAVIAGVPELAWPRKGTA